MHAMVNPYACFDLFCVCNGDGVRVRVGGVLERVQIFS